MDSPSTEAAPTIKDVVANTRESSMIAWGVVAVGILLSLLAWTRPTTVSGDPAAAGGQRSMTFSYTATVPRTPAYQSTEVTAPEPVFRKLADTVQVGVDYVGDPGVVTVDAQLSTDSGWHWTVPLAGPQDAVDGKYQGSVTLDLNELERRAEAGTKAAGIPMSSVSVSVVPTVITDGGEFKPALPFTLGTESLSLQTPDQSLTVQEGGGGSVGTAPPRPTHSRSWA